MTRSYGRVLVLASLLLALFTPLTPSSVLAEPGSLRWTFDDGDLTGWVPIVGWNSVAGAPEYPQDCSIVSGEYSLTTCHSLYRLRNFTDFVFEAQVKLVQATGEPIRGMSFRQNPAAAQYADIVAATGDSYTLAQGYDLEFVGPTLYLFRCLESCTVLASSSPSVDAYANSKLKIVAVGANIRAFVNDVQVMEVTDSTFSQGLVGLFSIPNGCGASGCTAVTSNFDNVGVTETPVSFRDDFDGFQLSSRWTTYVDAITGGVNLTVNQGLLHLNSHGSASNFLNIATPFVPTGDDLRITARVRAHSFGRFHMVLGTQPAVTTPETGVAAFEFDLSGIECGDMGSAVNGRFTGSWTYSMFYCGPEINTWYWLQLEATRDPWVITWNLRDDSGSIIASATAADMSHNFDSIQYLGLGVWCGWDGCISDYDVDWVTTGPVPETPMASISTTKFFTDPNLNPLALDQIGNPKVDVILANGKVRSTSPGRVISWVNVTNNGDVPLQSLILNETLPVDWIVQPPWMPPEGAVHVYFVFVNGTRMEITDPATITVTTGNPQTILLSIPDVAASPAQQSLGPGESILLSVKLAYGLVMTSQSSASFLRNYTDTANAQAWADAGFTGDFVEATTSAFFTAYARVLGDVNGDFHVDIVDLALVGSRFGTSLGNSRYDGTADLDNSGTINTVDLAIVASWYGTSS